jgi:cell division protein FtsL
MEATEYALRKVVRNNTIVREIDEVRQREMWQWACIGVVFVLVLLVTVWQQTAFVTHGYAVEQLRGEREREQEKTRRLLLEIETLRAPKRIQQIATQQLHMVAPTPGEAVVVERVVPAPRPAASVVAAR